jgi:hypothetical protein
MFTSFYQARRDAEFSIGWSNNNQLNDFQMRKSKNKEVTGKITTQSIIQGQDLAYPQRQLQAYDPTPKDCTPHVIQISAFSMRIPICPRKSWRR